jgi:iron complex outermembrane receptor protein
MKSIVKRDCDAADLGLRPVVRAIVAACCGAGVGLSAGAQQLEEIIVTAERRELSLQETPISVMAFSGDMLEFKGVRDLHEIAELTPNLDVKGTRGTGNTSLSYQVRGISGGGAVGTYIDNVFMPRTTGPVMRVLDLERLEVLRGPQGTLFGRNNTAGAIRVFTKEPGPDQDAYLRVTGGSFSRGDVVGMINVPLSDNFFIRAQGAVMEQDGFVRRGPQVLGSTEDTIARLRAAWLPSDTVKVVFSLMRNDSESDGSATDLVQFNMAPACPFPSATVDTVCWQGNYADWMSDFLQAYGQPRLRDNDPRLTLDDYTMPDFCFLTGPNPDWDDACLQWNKNNYAQFDTAITWDISDRVSMVSTTGLSDFSSDGVSDWQLLGMEFRRDQTESKTIWQEVVFNIDLFDDNVQLVTGANYFSEELISPRAPLYNAIGSSVFSATSPTGGTAFGDRWGCAGSGTTPPLCSAGESRLRRTADTYGKTDTESLGAFISANWHMTDRLGLTLGLRGIYEERDVLSIAYASDNFVPQNGVEDALTGNNDWSETDWRATLDFRVTDDLMLYFTSSKAFRAGTFASQGSSAPTAQRPWTLRAPMNEVPPERLNNREIGMRSEWIDSRLRFNATAFDMTLTDRQGATAVPDATSSTGFTIQVLSQGDVDLDGVEIEASFAVTDRFTLDASAGWIDYVMENPCINNGLFLIPSPIERSWNLGTRYDLGLSNGASWSIGFDYSYDGAQETHPGGLTPEQNTALGCPTTGALNFQDSRYRLDGYGLLDATVRYAPANAKWALTLYGANLTDEHYGNNAQAFGRGYWTAGGPLVGINNVSRNAIAEFRGRPREYGLTFQYNFY